MSTFAKTGRNIICIGRNYVAHVHELNNKVPKEPFYFLKPTSSYIEAGQGPIEVPQGINCHHEGVFVVSAGPTASGDG
jgi:acylpyruvate hydrolase